MYIYDIITETFVEFYYRDLNKAIVTGSIFDDLSQIVIKWVQ